MIKTLRTDISNAWIQDKGGFSDSQMIWCEESSHKEHHPFPGFMNYFYKLMSICKVEFTLTLDSIVICQ
jgi:hypothetical protein